MWSFHLVAPDSAFHWFQQTLSPDENERAARLRFDHLRRSFVIARGTLRTLLGRYLTVPPASLQFTYNSKGKPALPTPAPLHFNASHSGGLSLIALTLDCEIGVDIEHIRPVPEMQSIARRFFCPEEAADLASLALDQREAAFFACWTRKEAYIKALGEGLFMPLDSFRVGLLPGQPARFLQRGNNAGNWTLQDLQVLPDYAAALAYADGVRSVTVFPPGNPDDLILST